MSALGATAAAVLACVWASVTGPIFLQNEKEFLVVLSCSNALSPAWNNRQS
jgi:hypothetical protein